MSDTIITAFGLVFYKEIIDTKSNIRVSNVAGLGDVEPVALIGQSYDNTKVRHSLGRRLEN